MGGESSGGKDAPPRKMKFAAKIPPRNTPRRPVEVKSEAHADHHEEALNQELLKRFKIQGKSGQTTVERKSAPVQVVFGQGTARTSEFPRGPSGCGSKSSGTKHKEDSTTDGKEDSTTDNGGKESAPKAKKEYVEPWDYSSYYPTTLPLRRPHSGKPELLDAQEFGEASADFDETSINPAAELGVRENEGEKMILFQLPPSLPLIKRAASKKGKEKIGIHKPPPMRKETKETACSLEDLPDGFMGKMLVYKSGAVKMKLGDILYDISPGVDCSFAQDVAAINVKEKHCCVLGAISKRAIVTPNVDSLIDHTSS